MNKIFKLTLFFLLSLLFVANISVYGQSGLQFRYQYNDFSGKISSTINIISPDNVIHKLYSDTAGKFSLNDENFFTKDGKYTLSVLFESEKYGRDSINYDFTLNGSEIYTEINTRFFFKNKSIKQGNKYIEGEKIPKGWIEVVKNYDAPESIEISLNTKMKPSNTYRGPYFIIKNNTSDTLYGEFLPGYFWGRLKEYRNGVIIDDKKGYLDLNFTNSPPLYPDSSDLALVGSFGYSNNLEPAKYIYEIRLGKEFQPIGVSKFLEKEDFEWWADTKQFYVLKCEFEIKETTEQ
ncbi:MAG: hypothetical protein HY959_11225 [Ignavibacteriae bacterium]|nr:hypothetical protein [Ignavibacteriota bacterium]